MIGAIIGDIAGSRFEFDTEKRPLQQKVFEERVCRYTDDSLMTLAVADALLLCNGDYTDLSKKCIISMKRIFNKHQIDGWGDRFYLWLKSPDSLPYNSCGNGAGMRISPVGWFANSEEEVKELSRKVTEISHNHPEGIKGAEAIAMAIYLARTGKTKEEIKARMIKYYPKLNDKFFNLSELLRAYNYDGHGDWITCQGSVPQAIVCFLESNSFENAVLNAISIGGDSDTIGAMTGSMAEAFYGVPLELEDMALTYLDSDLWGIYYAFLKYMKERNTGQSK